MARPSKVDRLPVEIRDEIARLREHGRTIDEILTHLRQLGVTDLSRGSLGRHVQKWDKIQARLQESAKAAEMIMGALDQDGRDERLTRFNIRLMHASLNALLVPEEDGEMRRLEPEEAMLLSTAIQRLAQAAKTNQDAALQIRREMAKKAEEAVERVAAKRGLSRDVIAEMKAEFLGMA
jgi:hypothetical protein